MPSPEGGVQEMAPCVGRPSEAGAAPGADRRIGKGWVAFTYVLMWALFLQSVSAGRIPHTGPASPG